MNCFSTCRLFEMFPIFLGIKWTESVNFNMFRIWYDFVYFEGKTNLNVYSNEIYFAEI